MTKEAPAAAMGNKAPWKASLSPIVLSTAAVAGALSGLICVGVRLGLSFLQWAVTGETGLMAEAAAHLPLWRRLLTPVLGAIVATVLFQGARKLFQFGKAVDYVEAVRFRRGRIPFVPTLWRTLTSIVSLVTGAAIGREGSMIQFASASIAGLGLRWVQRTVSLDRLVALGAAGAVAAVYKAPLGGMFFALEIVLGARALSMTALVQAPALMVAAGAGAWMSHLCLGGGRLFSVTTPAVFHWIDAVPILIGAVAIGSMGPIYFRITESLRWMKSLPWPMVWSGLLVGLLSCMRPEVWGNGENGVLEAIRGTSLRAILELLALRLLATAACVGSGVVGGVFTPTIFAGSVLGLAYGYLVRHAFAGSAPGAEYAILGIVCLLAAVTHSPCMAAFMTVELTGEIRWLPVVLLCSLIAFAVGKALSRDSLYSVAGTDPGKVLARKPEEVPAEEPSS